MKKILLVTVALQLLCPALLACASPAAAVEDTFFVEVGVDGNVTAGGGSGFGLGGGTWFYYENTDSWRQWFYNGPYDGFSLT